MDEDGPTDGALGVDAVADHSLLPTVGAKTLEAPQAHVADQQSAKRQQLLTLLSELEVDSKLTKQVETAVAPKQSPPLDKQAARIQLAKQEKALAKQKTECQTTIAQLQEQLGRQTALMQTIEEELAKTEKARIKLDEPTPEEAARARAEQHKAMTDHVDRTLMRMRDVMVGNDWEADALKHQEAYEAWKQERDKTGQPSAPLGRWYVTHVLMPQLTNTMHEQPVAAAAAAAACAAAPSTPTGACPAKEPATVPLREVLPEKRERAHSEPRGRRRSRSRHKLEAQIAADHAQRNPAWEHQS